MSARVVAAAVPQRHGDGPVLALGLGHVVGRVGDRGAVRLGDRAHLPDIANSRLLPATSAIR